MTKGTMRRIAHILRAIAERIEPQGSTLATEFLFQIDNPWPVATTSDYDVHWTYNT